MTGVQTCALPISANRANPRRRRKSRREKPREERAGDVLFAGEPESEGEALFPLPQDLSSDGFFTRLSALPGVGLDPAPAKEGEPPDAAQEDAASLFPEEEEPDAEVLFPEEGELLHGGFFTRLAQAPAAEPDFLASAAARDPLPDGEGDQLHDALFPDPLA